MAYGVRILEQVTAALIQMDEASHELFVMAMLDLASDPHSRGHAISAEGSRTTRTLAMGALGLIVYIVDDAESAVEVADVISLDG
jgi:hypothetical protein